MSQDHKGNVQPSLDREEHATVAGIDGKKVFILDNAGNQITSFGGFATVTLQGLPTVSQGTSPWVSSLPSGATVYQGTNPWITSLSGNATVVIANILNSLTTITNAISLVGSPTITPLQAWPNPNTYIGLTTTTIGNVVNSIATIANSLATVAIGTSLPAGTSYIGSATVANATAWPDPKTYIGLTTTTIGNLINSITTVANSLVTITPTYISGYTAVQSIFSGAGNATLFVPPSNQRWILKDLIVGSSGNNEVQIKDGTVVVIPMIGLATTGGYISNFGDSGLRSGAINNALVANLNGNPTISIMANVRFDS